MKKKLATTKMNHMLLRMISQSKGQFAAVMTIVIVGIAVYISMSATAVNLDNTVQRYYKETHFADIFVEAQSVPAHRIDQLEELSQVSKAEGRIVQDAPMIAEDKNERINLRLIAGRSQAQESDKLNAGILLEGREFEEGSREGVVLQQFAQARGIEVGDELKVQGADRQYTIEVVGIAANPEYIYMIGDSQVLLPDSKTFGVCYVSETLGGQIAGMNGGSYNSVLVDCAEGANQDDIIDEIKDTLSSVNVTQAIRQKDQLSNNMIQQELEQLATMSDSLPILFLLAAGLILMMILSRMVKRDRMKIGVLKALGYSDKAVMLHYVKYALIAGVLGGIVGAVVGIALSGAMTKFYLEFFFIPILEVGFFPSYFFLSVVLSAIFCAVAGLIGAKGVLKITPADAMRNETPKAGKRILLEKMGFFWKRQSFSRKMVLRNIFRNKKRTVFVLMGVAVTYALMLFTTCMPGTVDDVLNKHFQEFQTMDYNINFRMPVKASAAEDLRHVIDVDYMEGKLEYPFELSLGNKKKTASIVGLSADTRFYSFETAAGRPVPMPKNGILLTENLAAALGASPGDKLLIKSLIPGREDVYVTVIDVVKQSLGMSAYMEQGAMGETLLEKNIITGVYVNSEQTDLNEKLIPVSNISSVLSTEEMRNTFLEFMTMMWLSIGTMIVFSGVLGFCIVYNATIISIGEREMEFSSLRVLGFGKNQIFRMVLNENTYISLAAAVLGIPLGKLMIQYSSRAFQSDLYSLSLQPNLTAYGIALLFTGLCVFLAQLATYRKIYKLEFLQALKNRTS